MRGLLRTAWLVIAAIGHTTDVLFAFVGVTLLTALVLDDNWTVALVAGGFAALLFIAWKRRAGRTPS